jgi:hypothetical protein
MVDSESQIACTVCDAAISDGCRVETVNFLRCVKGILYVLIVYVFLTKIESVTTLVISPTSCPSHIFENHRGFG